MRESPLQVLLVQDGAQAPCAFEEMFRAEKPFELIHVGRMSEAESYLTRVRPDVILLDMESVGSDEIGTVRQAHAMAPGTPLVLLTAASDEAAAAQAKNLGVTDYLLKEEGKSRALPRTLRHAIELRRVQAETDLLRAYQERFEDEFLSHVSHELRSPLNSIYQFVTILLDGLAGDLQPQQAAHLEIVLRNVQHLQSMINDLFEAQNLSQGKLLVEPQPTSLGDAILDTIHTLQFSAAARQIDLFAEIEGPLPQVFADPTRLRQMLSILTENGIKFTPPHGTVKMKARAQGQSILFEISDSGCGIAPQYLEQIFEHRFQAPGLQGRDPAHEEEASGRRGLGLGLYICKDLVARHGGAITVSSKLQQGTTFLITLPQFHLEEQIRLVVESAGQSGGPFTLLVVEMASRSGWLSNQARAQHGQALREDLQQCLYVDRHALLPRMGASGGVELFFVVAAGTEPEVRELAARIDRQISCNESLEPSGIRLSTSLWFLKSGGNLETLAAEVQQHVDQEISQRMVRDGQ
jgi:signal transduction histidine kinase